MRLRWLGGAGFTVKTGDLTIGIDLYLSNACMREDGSFKRLVPPPVTPESLTLDYLIASHEHGDHFDIGSMHSFIRGDNVTRLICSSNTAIEARRLNVDTARIIELNRGGALDFDGFSLRAVMADHGEDSPDAIGFFINANGNTIYFTGDTCFRTDFMECIGPHEPIDALLVPINGRFGNPDGRDAAYFAQMLKPKVTIPCHFWLFAEHGGDPGQFLECCAAIAPDTKAMVLSIGEEIEL